MDKPRKKAAVTDTATSRKKEHVMLEKHQGLKEGPRGNIQFDLKNPKLFRCELLAFSMSWYFAEWSLAWKHKFIVKINHTLPMLFLTK